MEGNSVSSYAGLAFNEHGVTNYSLHYRLYVDKGYNWNPDKVEFIKL